MSETDQWGNSVYTVKAGEEIDALWLRSHPEVTIVRGAVWDVEKEEHVYGDMINPWGQKGYERV